MNQLADRQHQLDQIFAKHDHAEALGCSLDDLYERTDGKASPALSKDQIHEAIAAAIRKAGKKD